MTCAQSKRTRMADIASSTHLHRFILTLTSRYLLLHSISMPALFLAYCLLIAAILILSEPLEVTVSVEADNADN